MGIRTFKQTAMFPLAWLGTTLAVGVLAGLKFSIPLSVAIAMASASTALALASLGRYHSRLSTILTAVAFLFVGLTLATLEGRSVAANRIKVLLDRGELQNGQAIELTGVLEREPEMADDRRYLVLRAEQIRARSIQRDATGLITLLVPITAKSREEFVELDLRYGTRVRVMTTLDRMDKFRNPGVAKFTDYLDSKGYDAAGLIKSPLLIERLDDEKVFRPLAWLYQWRSVIQSEIDSRLSDETGGVLDAALLGNRYNLSHESTERFKQGGTFHVLVISGLHITFLGSLIFFVTRRFTKSKFLQFLVSVIVVWSYSLAVGAEASVVRAALMFTFVLAAPLLSRRANSLNTLGAVGIVLLVWRPSDLLDPSFQLTFASVLAILVFAWPLLEKMSQVGGWRPSRDTPYPPACASWFMTLSECLFWSEKKRERELKLTNYRCSVFKSPLSATLERLHLQATLRYCFAAVIVSASVQLVLLPFLVVYFHRLSLASFLLNIIVSVLMGGVTFTAVTGLVIAQVSAYVARPMFEVAHALNWLMMHSVDPFEQAGVASFRLPEYTGWRAAIYVMYYVPLAVLAAGLLRWQPLQAPTHKIRNQYPVWLAGAFQLLAISCVTLHPWSVERSNRNLRIDFLDVGQGDAALLTLPEGTTILIDGGGQAGSFSRRKSADGSEKDNVEQVGRSVGETVVSEYLWWRGLDFVDYVIATHADADHIDGLNDVARNFGVRAAFVARTPQKAVEYSKFAQTFTARSIPVRLIGAGDELRIGEVSISVLWPPASSNGLAPSRNNDSVVLRVKYGTRSILLAADIEEQAEKALLRSGGDLKVDLVKVAHHGSKTSSLPEFVATSAPSVAVISVGRTSIFGHPHAVVVERWKAAGVRLLTTGESGTITITTDGKNLTVGTFVNDR